MVSFPPRIEYGINSGGPALQEAWRINLPQAGIQDLLLPLFYVKSLDAGSSPPEADKSGMTKKRRKKK
jgi:hypothetical protein